MPTAPVPLGVPGSWELYFRDEFDGASVNSNVWLKLRGSEGGLYEWPANSELDDHAFSADYATVSGGNLRLRWDNTPRTLTGNDGSQTTFPYTAGMVHSGKGLYFTYGCVEVRAWFTDTRGLWQGIWMLSHPIDQDWPPEIDIAEILEDPTDGIYSPHFNYHWSDSSGAHQQMQWKTYGQNGVSYAGEWHTYGLVWSAGFLQVYIDGQAGPSYTNSEITSRLMYLILMPGVRKGYKPANGEMLVDYVRVWKAA